jgi:hypothetical protein
MFAYIKVYHPEEDVLNLQQFVVMSPTFFVLGHIFEALVHVMLNPFAVLRYRFNWKKWFVLAIIGALTFFTFFVGQPLASYFFYYPLFEISVMISILLFLILCIIGMK